MTFQQIFDQAVAMLQPRRRIAYSALKRQFDLDDAYLEVLKDALLFAYLVVDKDGRGLVWTGAPARLCQMLCTPRLGSVLFNSNAIVKLTPISYVSAEFMYWTSGRMTFRLQPKLA